MKSNMSCFELFALTLKVKTGTASGTMCIYILRNAIYLNGNGDPAALNCNVKGPRGTYPNCPIAWAVPASIGICYAIVFTTLFVSIVVGCNKSSVIPVTCMPKFDFCWHMIAAALSFVAGGILISYGFQGEEFYCGQNQSCRGLDREAWFLYTQAIIAGAISITSGFVYFIFGFLEIFLQQNQVRELTMAVSSPGMWEAGRSVPLKAAY